MHIKMHISCRNRKQYEQRNCKTIHTQSIHRKGTVPIPPADESAGFLGIFFIEYSGNPNPTLFIEAQSQVICLSIPFAQNREILDQDPVFLRVLIRSLADKLSLSSTLDAISISLHEKVLVYLQQISPDHRITSVNHTMTMLHCSRRQLQRVLSDLCRQGILIKEGRGQYILNPSHPTHS